jgi:hypothetical protein
LTQAAARQLLGMPARVVLVIAAGLSLVAVSLVLIALWSEFESYRLHLKYRHRKGSYRDATAVDKAKWDLHNRRARRLQPWAFIVIAGSVACQAAFFWLALPTDSKGKFVMHHFGEDSTIVIDDGDHYLIIFQNKDTKKAVTMNLPKSGIMEDGSEIDHAKAEALAHEVAHQLRKDLSGALQTVP